MSDQELRIAELRQQNYSYRFIGDALSLSPNTVKSICRRRRFETVGPRKTKIEKQGAVLCRNCHRLLDHGGRWDRLFCSDTCRMSWWKNNRKLVEKQTGHFGEGE